MEVSHPTTNSSNLDDIIKHWIHLLRNEKWQIRETIHYHRTAKKKEDPQAKELSRDSPLREHYDRLLEVFRGEVESQLRCCCSGAVSEDHIVSRRMDDASMIGCSSNHNHNNNHNNTADFDGIRHNPEIMMRVYSYLPLYDRICRLSLVDRAFSRDKIRGGIVSATYGGGFNLKQALLELQRWAREEVEQKSRMLDELNEKIDFVKHAILNLQRVLQQVGLMSTPRSKPHYYQKTLQEYQKELQRLQEEHKQAQKERQENHLERIEKISRMLEAANLADGELLLFTGSNLTNTIVNASERKRWMAFYVREFFSREKQQWEEQKHQGHSWLTEIVLVKTFLKMYFFDGNVNRLKRLIQDAGFEADFKKYKRCQALSKNDFVDEKMVWCLPNLSPGCNLLLLDPDVNCGNGDGGWKEYRFVTCRYCSKLHQCSQSNAVRCGQHGHHGHICNDCYRLLLLCVLDRPVPLPIESIEAMMICTHCRDMPPRDFLRLHGER